jgi:phosphinothricin acetyltransferase
MIRDASKADAAAVASIYNYYIETTVITFEEVPLTVSDMELRIDEITASLPWLVFERDGEVLGYAYASKWKGRCAYRHTVESTIYLKPDCCGMGIGKQLYGRLIDQLSTQSVHVVIGGVALPNPGSIALHEKLGFSQVAHFKQVGWKFQQWIDVGYWQRILG